MTNRELQEKNQALEEALNMAHDMILKRFVPMEYNFRQLEAAMKEMVECLRWAAMFAEGARALPRDIPDSTLNNPKFNEWIDRCNAAIAKTEGGDQ